MWVARDLDGSLWLYVDKKPRKTPVCWLTGGSCYYRITDTFPIVKWGDNEPTPVKLDRNNTLIIED